MNSNFGKVFITLTVSTAIGLTTLPAQAALLVSSSGDNSIKQYDETTGAFIRDFVTPGSGGLINPGSFSLAANGNLFVSSNGTNSIKEYSGTSGEYIRNLTDSNGQLVRAGNLATKDNSLFVVTRRIPGSERDAGFEFGGITFDSGVVEYDINTGGIVKSIGARTSSLLSERTTGPQPFDVAIGGPNNSLFLSSSLSRNATGNIREYDTTTGEAVGGNPVVGGSGVSNPATIAVSDSTVFYTDLFRSDFSKINRYDIATGIGNVSLGQPFINDSELNSSLSLAVGSDGNLFVGVSGTNSVKRYDGQTGNFLGNFIGSGSGGLSNPTYVTTANVPVPEPSSVLGVVALGGLFIGGTIQRRMYNRKR